MRSIGYILLSLALATTLATGVCAAAGWHSHAAEMIRALIVVAPASLLALLPALLLRKAAQMTVVQAGLAGSVLHLFATAGLAALATQFRPPVQTTPFLAWLTVLYWSALCGFAAAVSMLIRSAAAQPGHEKAGVKAA